MSPLAPSRSALRLAGVATFAVLAAACARGDTAAADSALARDLTLASSAAVPRAASPVVFADTSLAARSAAPAPAPKPAAAPAPRPVRVADASTVVRRQPRPEPTTPPVAPAPAPAADSSASVAPAATPASNGRELRAGSGLALSITSAVCSATNRPGDRFVATLTQPISSPDGSVLLPVGTNVVLELTAADQGASQNGHIELAMRGVAIDGFFRPVGGDIANVDAELERHRYEKPTGTSTAGKVGRGAMTGAILGRIFGGNKGTIIGAAAGAAAGAATAASAFSYQGCLPSGAPLRARLTENVAM